MINRVLERRTRYLTVVLEDIFQSHNASAVLRSCDCFGIQDVHIIENRNAYQVNPDVALGSYKWLTLYKYNQAEKNKYSRCPLEKLRGRDSGSWQPPRTLMAAPWRTLTFEQRENSPWFLAPNWRD